MPEQTEENSEADEVDKSVESDDPVTRMKAKASALAREAAGLSPTRAEGDDIHD